jgi:hypothetical protein
VAVVPVTVTMVVMAVAVVVVMAMMMAMAVAAVARGRVARGGERRDGERNSGNSGSEDRTVHGGLLLGLNRATIRSGCAPLMRSGARKSCDRRHGNALCRFR